MSRTLRTSVGLAAAATAAIGLVASGAGTALSAPHGHHAALAHTPKLSVTISKKHFHVVGPKTFRAGRVAISLKAVGGEQAVQVAQLKKGYTYSDLKADIIGFGSTVSNTTGMATKAGMKHLHNALRHTTLLGGLDTVPGTIEKGTVLLARPGNYIVYHDDQGLPGQKVNLTVTGPKADRATPRSSATVIAMTDRRFGGAKTLPGHGIIKFANHSTESPHFLVLQQVKAGTTRKEVITALESSAPPTIFLKGAAETDAISEGQSQTLTLDLPKGTYAEACFFPDPGAGMGTPHAFMGMVNIVKVK
jgi:hypothetical protein